MMLKSYPIRFAVNLCLVAALLVSPGSYGSAQAAVCQENASTTAKCAGCGHCSVDNEGSRCGCCCRKNRKDLLEKRPAKSCCQETPDSGSSESSSVGVCLCGTGSQPAVPASQNRLEVEQILKLAPRQLSFTMQSGGDSATRRASILSPPKFLLPHAAQRLLCMWLI